MIKGSFLKTVASVCVTTCWDTVRVVCWESGSTSILLMAVSGCILGLVLQLGIDKSTSRQRHQDQEEGRTAFWYQFLRVSPGTYTLPGPLSPPFCSLLSRDNLKSTLPKCPDSLSKGRPRSGYQMPKS